MADNEQQIKFGAQTAELIKAIEGIKHQLEGLKEFASGLTEELGELFAAEKLVEFVKSMAELGEQTERTALTLGISTEAVGELSGIAKLTGSNMESLALTLERMSLNVQRSSRDAFNPTAQALKVIGLNAKDLIGLPTDKYFEKLADAISKFNPSLNLTNALTAIGGRGVAQMIPTLIEGKEAFEKYQQAIKNTGSVLSEATVKGMVETQHEIVLLGKSIQGLGATVFTGFKPAIDGIVLAFTDLVQWFRRAIEQGGLLEGVFKALTTAANMLAAALQSIVSLFEALMAIASFKIGLGTNFREEAARVSKELEGIGAKWKASMGSIFGADEHGGGHGEGEKENAKAIDEGLRQRLRMQQEHLDAEIKLIDERYKAETERLSTAVKTYTMTEGQKTAAQKAALNQRESDEQAMLQKELALWPAGSAEYQKILDRMTEAHGKFIDENKKLDDELLIKTVHDWTEDLGMIQRAWDSQLQGLLAHTTTWSAAMKKIVGDLVLEIIKKFETIVIAQPLASAAAKAFGAIDLTGIFKAIAALLGQTFTGMTAFFAPALGPAAVPAAAGVTAGVEATAMGLASSIPGAEIGAWNVPATSPWLLHRGETVLPSKAADAFRQMASGSGLGGATANFNITAMDGADVLRVLNKHANTFARVLQRHMAANPSSHR